MVDDPAHYRWSSYPANALGQRDPLITSYPLYTALAADEASRQACYRALFRHPLDAEAMGSIRLALNQSQPLGNARSLDMIERVSEWASMRGQAPWQTEDGEDKRQGPGWASAD